MGHVSPLPSKDTNKAKVLNAFIASVFLVRLAFRNHKTLETRGKVLSKEDLLVVEENQVREHFSVVELDVSKSMGPNRLHP